MVRHKTIRPQPKLEKKKKTEREKYLKLPKVDCLRRMVSRGLLHPDLNNWGVLRREGRDGGVREVKTPRETESLKSRRLRFEYLGMSVGILLLWGLCGEGEKPGVTHSPRRLNFWVSSQRNDG